MDTVLEPYRLAVAPIGGPSDPEPSKLVQLRKCLRSGVELGDFPASITCLPIWLLRGLCYQDILAVPSRSAGRLCRGTATRSAQQQDAVGDGYRAGRE